MRRSRVISAVVLLAVACGAARAGAPDDPVDRPKEEWAAEVLRGYAASKAAIRRIEYAYEYRLGERERRECRYARDGERSYHAHLMRSGAAVGLASEIAWDGRLLHERDGPRELRRTADAARHRTACPTVEKGIETYVADALGFSGNERRRYTLVDARPVRHEGAECVELRFDAEWKPGVALTVRHCPGLGYWPVYAALTGEAGVVYYELADVRVSERRVDGKAVFFPTDFRQHVFPGEPPPKGVTHRFEVVAESLRINEPIPAGRFALEPWPNQGAYDVDANRRTPPADPAWVPDERVTFPFDVFFREVEAARAKGAAR